jgi:hypothetical protein
MSPYRKKYRKILSMQKNSNNAEKCRKIPLMQKNSINSKKYQSRINHKGIIY